MTNVKCSRFAGSRNNYINIAEAGQMKVSLRDINHFGNLRMNFAVSKIRGV